MNKGLINKETKLFYELLIKANYEQLKAMEDQLIREMNKRK